MNTFSFEGEPVDTVVSVVPNDSNPQLGKNSSEFSPVVIGLPIAAAMVVAGAFAWYRRKMKQPFPAIQEPKYQETVYLREIIDSDSGNIVGNYWTPEE